jgi:hypothetical protein
MFERESPAAGRAPTGPPGIERGPGGGLAENDFGKSNNAPPNSRDRPESQASPRLRVLLPHLPRPAPGKERALILDHAGNSLRHGLYDFARTWSLDSKPRKAGTTPVKECPNCHVIVTIGSTACPECPFEFDVGQRHRERIEISGHLVEITQERLRRMSYRNAVHWGEGNPDKLRLVAEAHGYKRGWIWHAMRDAETGQNART